MTMTNAAPTRLLVGGIEVSEKLSDIEKAKNLFNQYNPLLKDTSGNTQELT